MIHVYRTVLLDPFLACIKASIDEEGVYPHHALWTNREGERCAAAMAMGPTEVVGYVWRLISCEEVRELIFGLDRFTRPGQGTEFADVLTCAHWSPTFHPSWNRAWCPFVINYQHEPRVVREPDYDNAFWNEIIFRGLCNRTPPFRMRTSRKGDKVTEKRNP